MVLGRISLNYIYKCMQHSVGRPALPVSSSSRSSRFLSSQAGDNNSNNDNESERGSEKEVKKAKGRAPKKSSEAAKAKLNDLLQTIVKEQETRDNDKVKDKIQFKLAKPIRERPPQPTEEEVKAATEEKQKEKEIGKELLSAVKTVAESVGGDPKEIETELVQKLRSHAPGKIDMSELFSGMKIDKTMKQTPQSAAQGQRTPDGDSQELSRAHRVRKIFDERRDSSRQRGGERGGRDRDQFENRRQQGFQPRQPRSPESFNVSYAPIDLFGAPPLGIFTRGPQGKSESKSASLKTWDSLHAKDLKLAATHPPANGFEEMILWTEQGKLWRYPINNEQDLDIEAKVSFHEHVFLEPYIESWCPKRGPVKHFMELVCVGLSKNPYLTVQEKKDHLEWYHEYFIGKSTILKDVGAGEVK